jgi:pyruvate dehydrogenase complex dehydrogenase (E1) component
VQQKRPPAIGAESLDLLASVQRRVLWLATSIVHHANKVRETPSGVKVGGHQASSAQLSHAIRDLGGHDLLDLIEAFRGCDLDQRPSVVFAYTIKAWGLPTQGHPANRSTSSSRASASCT